MKNNYINGFFSALMIIGLMSSCTKDDVDDNPVETKKEFVGSNNCKACHTAKFSDWEASGHPYKFTVVEDGVEPQYPAEAQNFQSTWMSNLGDGSHSWDEVAGVIGGYGWKTRFVGLDGYVMGTSGSEYSTALGHNQFNFFGGVDHGWVDYEKDNANKLYNYSCFKCHTTGGTTEGTWLEGVEGLGNFSEGGVGCESCHGPGSQHVASPTSSNIDRVYEFAHEDNTYGGLVVNGVTQVPDENGDDVNFLCGTCHNRGYTNKIDSKGGFIKHHEQWDELTSGVHSGAGISCTTCHDPHKRTIWDGDAIIKNCTECHTTAADKVNHSSASSCIDCHMPYAAKSGTKVGDSNHEGDVRSHLFKISVDGENMFNEDGSAVLDDETRSASLSVAYSCLGCHNRDANDNIPDKTLEQAIAGAANMHK